MAESLYVVELILKVTGQSSDEIFAAKNKTVYFSPTVHASNKLTRAT